MKVINYLFQLLVFATVAVSTVITQGQSIDRVANGAAPQYCQDGELKCHGLGRIVSYCINNNWGLAKVCAEDEICEHISTVQCVKRDLPLHQGAVARVRDAAMPKKLDITPAKDKIMTLIEEAGEAVDGDEAEEPHLPFCYWCNDYKEDCLDQCWEPSEPPSQPTCTKYCTEVACAYTDPATGKNCGNRCHKSLGCW